MASPSALAPAVSVTRDERGTHVEIPANVSIDEPIVITYDAADPALVPHTFVTAGENARAAIVERTSGTATGAISMTSSVKAGARSEIGFTIVQNVSGGSVGAKRSSHSGDGAHVSWNLALLGSAVTVDELLAELDAEGAEANVAALFFPVARENVQLTTEVNHDVPHTTSQTVVRSIAAGRGRGRYYGNIRIAKHAIGSEASLRDDTLLIGKDAKIDAIPALEIASNDVKAFHGATVGAIDEEHIFYIMSRGIDRDAAEKLIALGFFEPAVSRFPGEALREELRGVLEAKLAGARR